MNREYNLILILSIDLRYEKYVEKLNKIEIKSMLGIQITGKINNRKLK